MFHIEYNYFFVTHSEQENEINFRLINFYMPSMVLCAFIYMTEFNPLNYVSCVVSKQFS